MRGSVAVVVHLPPVHSSRRWPWLRGILSVRPDPLERLHFDRHLAGYNRFASPRERLVHVSGFNYPEAAAHVLLGLKLRPVGEDHPCTRFLRNDFALPAGSKAASKEPGAGGIHLFVERADIAI